MPTHQHARDMAFSVEIGQLSASMSAEGVSWSPDVADDMVARCLWAIRELMAEAYTYGLLQTDSEVTFDDGTLAETGADEDGE